MFGFQHRILFEQEVLQALVTYLPHVTETRTIGPSENYNNLLFDLTNRDICVACIRLPWKVSF